MKKYQGIRQFFKDNIQISKRIKNTKLDEERFEKGLNRKDLDIFLDNIYKRYGIARYESKDAMRQDMLKYGKGFAKNVDMKWEEYLHREDLMISGQYDDLRASNFRNNYLKSLSLLGVDHQIIVNLETLTEDEWSRLMEYPNKDNLKARKYYMPAIQDYYPTDDMRSNKSLRESAEEEIENAYRDVFNKDIRNNYIDDGSEDRLDSPSNIQVTQIWAEDSAIKDSLYYQVSHNAPKGSIGRLLRKVPKRFRNVKEIKTLVIDAYNDNVTSREIMNNKYNALSYLEKKGTMKIRKTKRGNLYYPFYLSKAETANYLAWKKNNEQ